MGVVVCILVHGAPPYFQAARQAVLSLLDNTGFHVFVGHDGDPAPIPAGRRVTRHRLTPLDPALPRPYRFLRKFDALSACLAASDASLAILQDADALLMRPLDEAAVAGALGGAGLAMVEQATIVGSAMDRAAFRDHYMKHAVPVIVPGAPEPRIDRFRYFNSGVVLARRETLAALAAWAGDHIRANPGRHVVGEHMVADQDYFQVWANSLHPGSAAELPWFWNHCEHWHEGFPRPDALFAHFSNFCQGPARSTPARMRRMRRPWRSAVRRFARRLPGASASAP